MRKENEGQTNEAITDGLNQITILPRINEENITQRKRKKNNSISEASLKRPKNTGLTQQTLPAWQPKLNVKTAIPLFFSFGIIFLICGIVLLHYSNQVNEFVYDYTDLCIDNKGRPCKDYNITCVCTIDFKLGTNFKAPVYIYYGLENYYQNHRRYVRSRDDNQLRGELITNTTINNDCEPYDIVNGNVVAPCGAIANSLFNGIAWTTDFENKFGNPENGFGGTVRPKNWQINVSDLEGQYKNEDLIVWMRTAAFSTFRKFYRRVDHSKTNFGEDLPSGNYSMVINHNYPVSGFNGRKSFIISTTSWLGGKNPFLGIAYLLVGSICVCLGFLFLIIHLKFPQSSNKTGKNLNTNGTNVSTIESSERT